MSTQVKTKEKQDNTNSTGEIIIQKIKLNNDGTAFINYKNSSNQAATLVEYSGKEEVTNEFREVFQKNIDGFLGILPELDKKKNKITMNAIRFDYDGSEKLKSAIYSVKYAFNDANNAVLNISTPQLPTYKEGLENTFSISGKHEELLHETIKVAKGYINGETNTKQLKLVVDNEEK